MTIARDAEGRAMTLDALADHYWQRWLERDHFLRAQLGLPIETIRPITYAHADAEATFAQGILDELGAIDAGALNHDRWLTFRALTWLATNDVAVRTYFWLRQEATPYAGGGQISYITSILTSFQFANAGDAERYESLMHQYAAFILSMRDLLVEQHRRGIILPNVDGVRLHDVNHQKGDLIFVFVIQLVEHGNLPAKGRSGVAPENQHHRLLPPKRR